MARGTVKATIFDQHPDVEIDLDEALKALEAEAPPLDGGGSDDTGEFVDLQELIRRIKTGESLHPSVRIIAGKYARKADVAKRIRMSAKCR